MILSILTEPHPFLHKKAEEIGPVVLSFAETKKLIANMLETMYAQDGAGLAAPQVGQSIRLCVIAKNYSPFGPNEDLVLVNPVWEKASFAKAWDTEGCLSAPEIWGEVKRYRKIKVKALDKNGRPLNFSAVDFSARAIQHEVDHLDGVLFIEKAKNLRREEKGKKKRIKNNFNKHFTFNF